MKKSFFYLQDPGHGYLLVPEQEIRAAGLGPKSFSCCSYVSRDGVFALEEDLDMQTFLNRMKELGIEVEIKERYVNSSAPCRNWPSNDGYRYEERYAS